MVHYALITKKIKSAAFKFYFMAKDNRLMNTLSTIYNNCVNYAIIKPDAIIRAMEMYSSLQYIINRLQKTINDFALK